MDVDDMGGSTLQAMAEAVEEADIVLICLSERYKESQNCRIGKIHREQERVAVYLRPKAMHILDFKGYKTTSEHVDGLWH